MILKPVDGMVLTFDKPVAPAKTTVAVTRPKAGRSVRPATAALSKSARSAAAAAPKNGRSGDRPATAAGHPKNLPRPETASSVSIISSVDRSGRKSQPLMSKRNRRGGR